MYLFSIKSFLYFGRIYAMITHIHVEEYMDEHNTRKMHNPLICHIVSVRRNSIYRLICDTRTMYLPTQYAAPLSSVWYK
mgnify:CR=1 FL=1